MVIQASPGLQATSCSQGMVTGGLVTVLLGFTLSWTHIVLRRRATPWQDPRIMTLSPITAAASQLPHFRPSFPTGLFTSL